MSLELDKVLSELNKVYGKGTVDRMKDMEDLEIDRISTGLLSLDIEIGGGYPRGRIVEIYGPEASGKTTLTLQAIRAAQFGGENVALIDAEHAFDPEYAEGLGVDVDNLILSQPDNGEQALEIVSKLCKSNQIAMIIVDSVSALVPKSELEGEMGDASVGKQARMMSQAMRKLVSVANNSNTTIVFINQIKMKIGVMFGSPETTSGGNALKFAASVRLDIRRSGTATKDGELPVGVDTKIKVIKNKVGRPFGYVKPYMQFGKGFVRELDILDLATNLEIIKKAGSHYSYRDTKLGQGKINVCDTMIDNPEMTDEIESAILDHYQLMNSED